MQGTRADRRKRIIIECLFILLLAVLVVVDQITKKHFSSTIKYGESVPIIDGFFYFSYYINTGAAWSFLSGVSWAQTFFKVLTAIALVLFIIFYIFAVRKNYKWLKVSLILIISGTLGNFIDRLILNGVIDFISFVFGSYHFPVFNLADSFLVVGVIMLLIHFLFIDEGAIFKRKDGKENTDK